MKLNKTIKTLLIALFLFSVGMNMAFLYNNKKTTPPRNNENMLQRIPNGQRPMHWLKRAALSEKEVKTFRQHLQKFEQECRIIEKQSHELRRQLLEKIIDTKEQSTETGQSTKTGQSTETEQNTEIEIEDIKQKILQKQAILQDLSINFLKQQKEELGPEKQRNILELFMRMNYEPQRKKRRRRRGGGGNGGGRR